MEEKTELELLLVELRQWAEQRRRIVDVDVLDNLLDLRETYRDTPLTRWPAGSVTDLLLDLWPAKGDGEPPDVGDVALSFESWFRFLRNTGRLASGSADPKVLAREARKAAPLMAERGADRSQWSIGKTLTDHARQLGVDLEGAESTDDLNARMALVSASWNSLPVHERQRLMPRPGDEDVSGCERAMAAYAVDDPVVALVMSMRHELPTGPLPESSLTAPLVRDSGLLHDVRQLLEALPDRVEVTSTGVLRPALARELHETLRLSRWEQASRDFSGHLYGNPEWRTARDLLSLNRLWVAAAGAGWLRVSATRATVVGPAEMDDEACVAFALRAGLSILLTLLDRWSYAGGLLYLLLRSYIIGCERVSWDEVGAFLSSWGYSPQDLDELRASDYDVTGPLVAQAKDEAFTLADAGFFTLAADGLTLTPLGDVFVTAMLNMLEDR